MKRVLRLRPRNRVYIGEGLAPGAGILRKGVEYEEGDLHLEQEF
jgi:hypothetical protein